MQGDLRIKIYDAERDEKKKVFVERHARVRIGQYWLNELQWSHEDHICIQVERPERGNPRLVLYKVDTRKNTDKNEPAA